MTTIKSYRDLQVWQRAVAMSVDVYTITEAFPQTEIYGLTSQMRRASVSVASNIAEAFGRSNRRFAHYLQLAMGSLAELETQAEIARRIGYLSDASHTDLSRELTVLGKQLNVLRQRVTSSDD